MSAANDIHYGCGYLVDSNPPQYSLAASYFRQALAKEPANAVAHFLLGVSFAGTGETEQARSSFAEASRGDPAISEKAAALFERRPALRALVEGALANRAAPAAPASATAPATTGATASPAFAVGAAVEIEYRNGEWLPGVVTSVDAGPCPYYRVQSDPYGRGNPSNLGYGCKSVRAPTGTAPPARACGGSNPNCSPKSPPPLGQYACNVTRWDVAERRAKHDYKGYFELLPGGRYRWLDNGGSGTYAYDAATHRLFWRSGPLQAQGGRAQYGLDGTTPEITITMESEYTRRTGNEPPQWQCARESR